MHRRTLGFAILRQQWTICLAVFRYFGRYQILSSKSFNVFRAISSFRFFRKQTKFENYPAETRFKLIEIVPDSFHRLHTRRKKSEIKPLLFGRLSCDFESEIRLERRIRKLLSPECLNIYKFLIAISMLFVLSILLAILGYLPILFFSNAAFRTQNIPLRILVLNVNQNRKYGSL